MKVGLYKPQCVDCNFEISAFPSNKTPQLNAKKQIQI